ncbi:Penicillin-binding protein 1A [Achromobacter mucicolens]|uniref:penicillin-binding protein 1A n=1 Tax=Achromobacter mucicolens TaxID=1389922 RepID=UPI000B922C93|nr:PBP1A family penicillin-binding protein [Achromobacter mucicolens]MDG9969119.1 PBP1A family penicillin-binding protein [Achromobacter mucicolens]OXC88702.1 penicillin-binding protein [Achromobacter sp. KAs 3-5]WBX88298.1 PBP1A family penicillin-binding protein [Achromobacter mucicolens]CAB3645334.1 Penicillin-binding protein 1A [Achromobacter mucicolens]
MSKPQNSSKKDKPASSGSPILRFFVKTGILFAGLFLCGVLLAGMALALAWPNLPDLNAMTDYRPRVPLRVYTADRVLIGEFGEERRNVLRFNEIPDVMKSAVLAAEDDRFYQHGGIDWMGVVRAGLTNLISMSKTQGASTITMQVARNFYLSSEKTYSRKFYELLLTFKIESELTKDQILELYMNQIYLGHRAYGFAAASRTYFGKPLSEVTPAEAAMLAGIPKAPSRFNPIANRPRAELRQRYVLGRMHSLGYLTEPEYKQAMAQPIVMKSAEGTPAGGYSIHGEYVAELARQLLYNVYQDNVYSRGINIYTTVQSKDQEAAYRAVREGVLEYTRRAPYPGPEEQLDLPPGTENNPAALDEFLDGVFDKFSDSGDLLTAVVLSASPTEVKLARSSREIITVTDKKVLGVVARALNDKAKPEQRIKRGSVVYIRKFGDNWEIINMPSVQAAFVALSPQDGAIRAMVGGFDFYRGNFNRVTQAWRQPGSNIKPFIYAASLERGLTPGTQISDQPFELTAAQTGSKAWNPKNYGNQYEPMLTLRQGLYKSKNMVSIRILQAIGPQYAQDYLTRFGFDKARQPAVLPLALGAGSVTPLQLAGAFSVFANGGYRVTPYLIDRVTDSSGKVIMQSKPVVAGDAAARAIDPRTAWVMDDILRGVTTYGTAARARALLKRGDIAGKTGTTNESVDAWFSGYTPTLAATAWLGFDQPKSLGSRETGGGVAMPIWVDYMQTVLKGVPEEKQRPRPDGLLVENGEFYFSEFPPGQAVARLGLPEADTLGEFLNGLTSGSGEDTRIKVAPGVGTQTATPWSQKIPF